MRLYKKDGKNGEPSRPRLPARCSFVFLAIYLFSAGSTLGRRHPEVQTEPWGSGADAVEESFLLNAEIIESKDLGKGVTRPRKVTLKLGDRVAHALWKNPEEEYTHPATGAVRVDDLYFSDRWHHEIAAYRLDRLIHLDRVPVTVVRVVDGKMGSMQAWIEKTFSERERVEEDIPLSDSTAYNGWIAPMHLFDALIYNIDRSQENILITEDENRVWLIDHSRAFRLRKQLPSMKQPPPPQLSAESLQALRDLDIEELSQAMDGLLSKGQLKGILARRDRLLKWLGEAD